MLLVYFRGLWRHQVGKKDKTRQDKMKIFMLMPGCVPKDQIQVLYMYVHNSTAISGSGGPEHKVHVYWRFPSDCLTDWACSFRQPGWIKHRQDLVSSQVSQRAQQSSPDRISLIGDGILPHLGCLNSGCEWWVPESERFVPSKACNVSRNLRATRIRKCIFSLESAPISALISAYLVCDGLLMEHTVGFSPSWANTCLWALWAMKTIPLEKS